MNNVELKVLENSLKEKYLNKECMSIDEMNLILKLIELKRFENKVVEETIERLRGNAYGKGIQN